jgi:hypothetical protein
VGVIDLPTVTPTTKMMVCRKQIWRCIMTIEGRIKDCWFLGGKKLSAIGAVFSGLHFWRLYSKEIQLEFGTIWKDNNNDYFSIVQQKGGKVKGKAINVESCSTLENMKYEYAHSVWADEKKKVVNIEEHENLFLFRLENQFWNFSKWMI